MTKPRKKPMLPKINSIHFGGAWIGVGILTGCRDKKGVLREGENHTSFFTLILSFISSQYPADSVMPKKAEHIEAAGYQT